MWQVWAETDQGGERIPLNIEQHSEVPSPKGSRNLVREAYGDNPPHAVRFLDSEVNLSQPERPLPGSDSITLWGPNAVREAEAFGEPENERNRENERKDKFVFDDPGLIWIPGQNRVDRIRNSPMVAWHDKTQVLVPVKPEYKALYFKYEPEPEDFVRGETYNQMFGSHNVFLEWRGYFGEESFVCDGIRKFVRRKWTLTTRLIGKTSGFLIGKVVNICGTPPRAIDTDPAFNSRLLNSEKTYDLFADYYPDLRKISTRSHESDEKCCFVFIHGTLSCCLESLHQLSPMIPKMYRFEHDTFLTPIDNAYELRDLILKNFSTKNPKNIYLIGHSRGGLVARYAAQLLAKEENNSFKPKVLTFGTPHNGTPLADASRNILHLLYKVGARIENSIPILGPLTAAYSYFLMGSPKKSRRFTTEYKRWLHFINELLTMKELPSGITAMSHSSDFLRMVNNDPTKISLSAFGGWVDMKSESFMTSFGNSFGQTAFDGAKNDLIVSTESATNGVGSPNEIPHCSHFGYFSNKKVYEIIGNEFRDSCLPEPVKGNDGKSVEGRIVDVGGGGHEEPEKSKEERLPTDEEAFGNVFK